MPDCVWIVSQGVVMYGVAAKCLFRGGDGRGYEEVAVGVKLLPSVTQRCAAMRIWQSRDRRCLEFGDQDANRIGGTADHSCSSGQTRRTKVAERRAERFLLCSFAHPTNDNSDSSFLALSV